MMERTQQDELGSFFRHGSLVAHRFYLIVSIFAVIIFCLLALDRFQAYALSSARAYVAGEGSWSKGQKDAVFHLLRYAATADEAHYRRFEEGIAVSLGDRKTRLTLQSDSPNIERAREGFIAGRNHPEDVDRMISLFLNFGESVEEMRQAIAIWTEADQYIDRLRQLGGALHEEIASGRRDPARIAAIIADVDRVNEDVSKLEDRFSATLGNASRRISRVAGIAMFASTLLLLLSGIYLSRRLVRGMRKTAGALVASEARFRRIVESSMIGIAFWGDDGSVTEANDALLAMLGFTRDELERGEMDWWELTPEDTRPRAIQALQEISQHGYCAPFERDFYHKDGHRVPVYLSASRFDNRDDGGVSFLLDITEHKRAEQLQKIAASVFKATQEAIIVADGDFHIKAVNPAFTQITGYEPAEVRGKSPVMLISAKNEPGFFDRMWQQIEKRGSWKGEIWNQRKDGRQYQGWLTFTVIRNDKGEISEYVGVFSDISEQRRMEEQLRQSQKMEAIGTLVGGIAHDFNNTLAAMEGNLYLARLHNGTNPDVADKLENLSQLSSHSAEMVQQLLTFARKGIVRMKPLSINSLLKGLTRLTATIIPENIAFHMHLCDEELTIKGDITQLQQVMLNLLNNARDALADCKEPLIDCLLESFDPDEKFLESHPQIEAEHLAHIVIKDNGCGIKKGQLEHIFEPFFTTKEVGKGTGLGMAMAYGSIHTHHGIIEVKSTVGKGTAVHLYLPLIEKEEHTGHQETLPTVDAIPPEQQATVLIVDDNSGVRTFCAEALKSMGYKTLTAEDGAAALECFNRLHDEIRLVITDVVMPRMGGFEIAKQMRQLNPDLPVIFVTGYDPEQVSGSGAVPENSDVLSKPFSIQMLAAKVRQMLATELQV